MPKMDSTAYFHSNTYYYIHHKTSSKLIALDIFHNFKIDTSLKGVLHPRPVFGLFLHFSQKLQNIGNKEDMFLIGNISGNLITALEFH